MFLSPLYNQAQGFCGEFPFHHTKILNQNSSLVLVVLDMKMRRIMLIEGNYSGLKEGCLSPQMSSPISGSSPLKVASSEGSSSRPCFFSVERYERVMQKA